MLFTLYALNVPTILKKTASIIANNEPFQTVEETTGSITTSVADPVPTTTTTTTTTTTYTIIDRVADTRTKYLVYSIAFLIFFVMFALGAGMMSWNYNMYIGNSKVVALFYVALSILFSELYYPFYSIMLNPITSRGTVLAPNSRGMRRNMNRA